MGSRQASIDALKATMKTYGVEFGMGWLATAAPFTQLPFIRTIIKHFMGKFMEDMLDESEFFIFSKYIDMRVDSQGIALEDAMLANYQGQTNAGLSQEQKDFLEKQLKEKFLAFASING